MVSGEIERVVLRDRVIPGLATIFDQVGPSPDSYILQRLGANVRVVERCGRPASKKEPTLSASHRAAKVVLMAVDEARSQGDFGDHHGTSSSARIVSPDLKNIASSVVVRAIHSAWGVLR